MTTQLTADEIRKKTERERKADYRRRKREAEQNKTVLVRKGTDNKNPTPQKVQINYDAFFRLMTLTEDDNRDTIKLYIDRVDRLYRNLFKVYLSPDNIDLLDKYSEILLYLDDTYNTFVMKDGKPVKSEKDRNTLETYRSYVNAILVFTDRLGLNNIKNKYSSKSVELNKMYNDASKSNIISTHEQNNWVRWNDINTMTERALKTNNYLNDNEKIVAILYNKFIAPRRIKDYELMKIIKYNTKNAIPKYILKRAEDDKTNNYMIVSSNNLVRRITFNNYKTKNTYGQIVVGTEQNNPDLNYFYLEPSVVRELQLLLVNKRDGDYLLVNPNTDKPYTQPQLTQLVEQTFTKITTKKLTCNMLRKIFITDNITNNPRLSTKTKEDIAKFMGHSKNTQETYNRITEGLGNNQIHTIRKGLFGRGEEEEEDTGEVIVLQPKYIQLF